MFTWLFSLGHELWNIPLASRKYCRVWFQYSIFKNDIIYRTLLYWKKLSSPVVICLSVGRSQWCLPSWQQASIVSSVRCKVYIVPCKVCSLWCTLLYCTRCTTLPNEHIDRVPKARVTTREELAAHSSIQLMSSGVPSRTEENLRCLTDPV